MDFLPQMRRENTNADTRTHGIGGFSSVLSEVQIHMRDIFQERENRRNQNARRLDAVQTDRLGCTAFIVFQNENEKKA